MRVVVFDFGAGWRKLLNAPGIEDMVDIRQLTPHGVRPLRWNPLQISRYIIPEVQMASFVDIFGNVAQLGIQFLGVLAVGAYAFVISWILLKVIDAVMGLRVSEEDEVMGLDISEHSERAYE
jgi:Amt family ammonium transporter